MQRRVDLDLLFRLLDLFSACRGPISRSWHRSASLIRITRTSAAIATISCDSSRPPLFAALELNTRQLRDALDELRDLVAKLGADAFQLDIGVFDDVVEERRGDRLVVEPELGTDLGGAPGVKDELLA